MKKELTNITSKYKCRFCKKPEVLNSDGLCIECEDLKDILTEKT